MINWQKPITELTIFIMNLNLQKNYLTYYQILIILVLLKNTLLLLKNLPTPSSYVLSVIVMVIQEQHKNHYIQRSNYLTQNCGRTIFQNLNT